MAKKKSKKVKKSTIKRTSAKSKTVKRKTAKGTTKKSKHQVKVHKPTKPKKITTAKAVMKKVPGECGECGSNEIVLSQLRPQVICKVCGAITPY